VDTLSAMPRRGLALLGVLCLALAACAGPVGTTRVDPKVVLRELDQSAITSGKPSLPTRNVLYEGGLFEAFDERPEAAIAELHRAMVADNSQCSNRTGSDLRILTARLFQQTGYGGGITGVSQRGDNLISNA